MRPTAELVRVWTEALVPVCNNSKSHASQEVKWLLQHAKHQSLVLRPSLSLSSTSSYSPSVTASTARRSGNSGGVGLSEAEVKLMQSYVDQRVNTRKPLQYILGNQPFMDLEILTRPPTLIPRWETEEWTARLATALKSNPLIFRQQQETSPRNPTLTNTNTTGPVFSILDICTGSGCIPLGLASALPPGSSRIFGTDIHPKAVQLARDNAAHNAALLNQNCVRFFQADLLAPNAVEEFLGWLDDVDDVDDGGPNSQAMYPSGTRHEAGMEDNARSREQQWRRNQRGLGRYNLIISNPPYIAHSEYEELEPEVAHWEDPKALLADQEGLVFYPRIANMAMELLHRQPASSSSSQSSTSVTDEGSKDRRTRELDPRTLERIDPLTLEQDEQQRRTDNHNSSNHDPEGEEEEDGVERTWRNGPELDKVKIPELVFEIGGDHQVDSVTAAVRQAGFRRVQVWKDLADRARCIVGAR